MKYLQLLVPFLLLAGCNINVDKTLPENSSFSFYAGTYTGSGSQGIYKCKLDSEGGLELLGLSAITENPSFLALNNSRNILLAVNETGPEGTVESYSIKTDSLLRISSSSSGGAHPCFVDINDDGYVLTANYSSGTVGLLKIDSSGVLTGLLDIEQHEGKGITERQQGPHAHSARFIKGSLSVVSVDLGTDELWFWDMDTAGQKLTTAGQQKIAMNPGAGPRHLAFHPDEQIIYVVNELNSTITLLKEDTGGYYNRGPSLSTLPDDYTGTNYCADIHISDDGKFVYASNRGHNSIAIFRTEPETGYLIPSGHSETCGEWPRNFALSPGDRYVVVANQHSNNIVSFSRDPDTGQLSAVDTIALVAPVCILF